MVDVGGDVRGGESGSGVVIAWDEGGGKWKSGGGCGWLVLMLM